LVPARDAVLARINAALSSEWSLATRGLGSLNLVAESADIAIYVLPGHGTSFHSLAPDGTQRILLYIVGDNGAISPENAVAVALHELGLQLASQKATIDDEKARAAALQVQIQAIEAQYPSRIAPPDVYATYQSLLAQYNGLADDISAKVAVYNALVVQRNALAC